MVEKNFGTEKCWSKQNLVKKKFVKKISPKDIFAGKIFAKKSIVIQKLFGLMKGFVAKKIFSKNQQNLVRIGGLAGLPVKERG